MLWRPFSAFQRLMSDGDALARHPKGAFLLVRVLKVLFVNMQNALTNILTGFGEPKCWRENPTVL